MHKGNCGIFGAALVVGVPGDGAVRGRRQRAGVRGGNLQHRLWAGPYNCQITQYPRQYGASRPNIHVSIVQFYSIYPPAWCHSTQTYSIGSGQGLTIVPFSRSHSLPDPRREIILKLSMSYQQIILCWKLSRQGNDCEALALGTTSPATIAPRSQPARRSASPW